MLSRGRRDPDPFFPHESDYRMNETNQMLPVLMTYPPNGLETGKLWAGGSQFISSRWSLWSVNGGEVEQVPSRLKSVGVNRRRAVVQVGSLQSDENSASRCRCRSAASGNQVMVRLVAHARDATFMQGQRWVVVMRPLTNAGECLIGGQ